MSKIFVSLIALMTCAQSLAAPAPEVAQSDPRVVAMQALTTYLKAASARTDAEKALDDASQACKKANADCQTCNKKLKETPKKSPEALTAKINKHAAEKDAENAKAHFKKMCDNLTAAKNQERIAGLDAAQKLLIYAGHPHLAKRAV